MTTISILPISILASKAHLAAVSGCAFYPGHDRLFVVG
ncbi:hypothetical protein M2367_000811 [Aeromonas sp. BIGb0445]|nr:hypothetical protein [Aeromonas sp. BIGb0445]